MTHRLVVVAIWLGLACRIKAFNLEYRIPVVKQGSPGTYFGYSVAEHRQVDKDFAASWLLVGAPKGRNLQPGTNSTGALWKCPLTTSMDDCKQVVTDGRRLEGGRYDESIDDNSLKPPRRDEIKEDQWLGVTVRSQGIGGKISVCAHRYTRVLEQSHLGQGLCYILNNNFGYDENVQSCHGRRINKEHEEFGYCQIGTSSAFLNDGTLILGSPGPYTWRGTLFVQDTNEDYIARDKEIYYGPVIDETSPVQKYSYLGMSVAGGYFFGPKISFVAGATRSNGTGQVVFFSKEVRQAIMNVSLTISGEQFASSFGYEVCALDLNGDGKTDLAVGAPFYFDRESGGSVYIYINENYSIKKIFDLKLTGKLESRFGFAISTAGDLNKDGCDDLAIGSPYEGDGVVYLYLGNRKTGLDKEPKQIIRAEMLPYIKPQMKTFGYSLSGGMDLDENSYPDLLVGAYQEDMVILLRARPIIDIKTKLIAHDSLTRIDPSKHGCVKDRYSNKTCFSFDICCTIEALSKLFGISKLSLNYVIEAETFIKSKKFSRVYFDSDFTDAKKSTVTKEIVLTKDIYTSCLTHTVYIKENTRDIQSPIKFQVNYTLVQKDPVWSQQGPLLSMDNLPILNATEAIMKFDALLLRDCGDDDICESDLSLEASLMLSTVDGKKDEYILSQGQDPEVKLLVTIDNLGEPAYETQIFISHHSGLSFIAAKSKDKYVICNVFNQTLISCSLENPFKKQKHDLNTIIVRFDPKSLENYFEKSINFDVWVNTTSRDIQAQKKFVSIEAKVVKNAELKIKGSAEPEQVFYGGEVKGESAMNTSDDIGAKIQHLYQVFNLGPWKVNYMEVIIDWPYQITSDRKEGKWLLYLESRPQVEGGEFCTVDKAYINPLGLKEAAPADSNSENSIIQKRITTVNRIRRKRETEVMSKPEALYDADGKWRQIIHMDCGGSHLASCVKIRCEIFNLAKNEQATIKIQARLWNSSLVEEYPNVQYVSIASRGTLYIPPNFNIRQKNLDDDVAAVQTKAYPDLEIREKPNYLWYIIGGIIIGILLLILLIFVLWKIGFFKRRRPDITLSGNIEKHESSPFLGKSL